MLTVPSNASEAVSLMWFAEIIGACGFRWYLAWGIDKGDNLQAITKSRGCVLVRRALLPPEAGRIPCRSVRDNLRQAPLLAMQTEAGIVA